VLYIETLLPQYHHKLTTTELYCCLKFYVLATAGPTSQTSKDAFKFHLLRQVGSPLEDYDVL